MPLSRRIKWATLLPLWVLTAFLAAQLLLVAIVRLTGAIGIPFSGVNQALFETILGACVYGLTLLLVIGVPWWIWKRKTTLKQLSLTEWPRWRDFLFLVGGFFAYLTLSGLLLTLADKTLPFVDLNQTQDVGFTGLSRYYEYALAFLTLVVIAPIAEEILFRGYLFGKLRQYVSLGWAILITSVLFGLVHMAWNVGIDTFALSVVMCLLVYWSGSIWPAVLLHITKNFIAFYFLFINPFL